MKKLYTALFTLLLSCLTITVSAQTNAYVDASATGNETGVDWENAYTDLQAALLAATAGQTIHVAQGAYKPDVPGGDPAVTFFIAHDLILLGGYPSGGGVRNPDLYPTVLSGDLNGDDVPGNFSTARADNTTTLVTVASLISATIDGFTIANAHSGATTNDQNARGGGLYAVQTEQLTIRNCRFEANFAYKEGGAMYLNGTDLQMENCQVDSNRANMGGGLFLDICQYSIEDCQFQNNSAVIGSLFEANGGGGTFRNSSGTIHNSTFLENSSEQWCGGLELWTNIPNSGSTTEVTSCTFEKNTCVNTSSGLNIVQFGDNGSYLISSCSFLENEADKSGGGMGFDIKSWADNCTITIDSTLFSQNESIWYEGGGLFGALRGTNQEVNLSNSTFLGNEVGFGGGGVTLLDDIESTGSVQVSNCWFEKNSSGALGGGMSIGGYGEVNYSAANCTFLENEAVSYAGGVDLFAEAPKTMSIQDCLFEGNSSGDIAGGLGFGINDPGLEAVIGNCQFVNNASPTGAGAGGDPFYTTGGGMTQEATIRFESCLFTNNTGEEGTIASRATGNIQLLNCTLDSNPAGGVALESSATATLQNNILHNPNSTNPEYEELSNDVVVLSNGGNLVRDASLNSGNPADLENQVPTYEGGSDLCETYRLSPGSPGLDQGTEWADAPEMDLCGNPRIDGQIDIGAIERAVISTTEALADQLTLFPVPAADFLEVQVPGMKEGLAEVSVHDGQGRLVLRRPFSIGDPIEVAGLASGFYTLKIVENGRVFTGKFVKQ